MAGFSNPHFGDREAWNSQVSQNSARTAWAWGQANSHGFGEFLIPDPIMFGLTFVYQPNVAHGWAMVDDDQLDDGRFPRCGGGVVAWIQDSNDHYIGAHVLVTVATADPVMASLAALQQALEGINGTTGKPFNEGFSQDPGYDITHSFTFVGMSYKAVS
jgi:hypothetical protein